jgi:hypothetical protein
LSAVRIFQLRFSQRERAAADSPGLNPNKRNSKMKKILICCAATLLTTLSVNGFAATVQVANTSYGVVTRQPEETTLPNGAKGMIGGQNHAVVVDDETGEAASQWCFGGQVEDANGRHGGGYCTIFYDNGDVLRISFTTTEPGTPLQWAVMGGTGRWAGATGGGTSTQESVRSDGRSWTSKAKGTITTR